MQQSCKKVVTLQLLDSCNFIRKTRSCSFTLHMSVSLVHQMTCWKTEARLNLGWMSRFLTIGTSLPLSLSICRHSCLSVGPARLYVTVSLRGRLQQKHQQLKVVHTRLICIANAPTLLQKNSNRLQLDTTAHLTCDITGTYLVDNTNTTNNTIQPGGTCAGLSPAQQAAWEKHCCRIYE
jgi:hypothetical protein